MLRLDTNLLILLVTGLVSTDIIARRKHIRLKKYFPEDFVLLADTIGDRRLCLLPNVATETHNLLGQHGEPERGRLLAKLGDVLTDSIENYSPSRIVVADALYARLGLTDTALFVTGAPALLTDDFGLYKAALGARQDATMFTHLRAKAGIIANHLS